MRYVGVRGPPAPWPHDTRSAGTDAPPPPPAVTARANGDDAEEPDFWAADWETKARMFVNSDVYWAVSYADALLRFLLFDAGFSGDWVRIHAITPEQEEQARFFALLGSAYRFATAPATLFIARERGLRQATWRTLLEGWAFGVLGPLGAKFRKGPLDA